MTTPALSLSDFAFTCPLPPAKDIFKFNEAVAKALLKAAGVSGAENVSLSSSMAEARPKNGSIALNVLGAGKKRGLVSEFNVTQAIFDSKGTPVAWSFALDPDGDPKRPDRLCARLAGNEDAKRVLALKVKPAKQAPRLATAFSLERPVDELVTARDLVAARCGAELVLFSTEGALLRTLKVGGFPRTHAVSADGTKVVSGLKKLKVFDRDGTLVTTLDGHPRGEVTALAFSASGDRIASGSALYFQGGERRVSLWPADGTKALATRTLEGGPVRLGFCSDGSLLVGTDSPEMVLRLDASLEVTAELRFDRKQMMLPIGVVGDRMMVRVDGKLGFIDSGAFTFKPLRTPAVPNEMASFALSPDGRRALVVSPHAEKKQWIYTAHVYDCANRKELLNHRLGPDGPGKQAFLDDRRVLIVNGRTATVLIVP